MKFVVLFVTTLLVSTLAIYADEKGKNEWLIENIGEVKDAIMINSQ